MSWRVVYPMSKLHGMKYIPTFVKDRRKSADGDQHSSGGPSESWRRLWAAKKADSGHQQEEGERDE